MIRALERLAVALLTVLFLGGAVICSANCAGAMTSAPLHREGLYLNECAYQGWAVCCRYASTRIPCTAYWCTSTVSSGWERTDLQCDDNTVGQAEERL